MAKTLVFLEHHEGAIAKGSLGVLAKAAQLGGEVAGVLVGSGVRALAGERGRVRRGDGVGRRRRRALAPPLPQPRVDVLAKLVRDEGFDTVLFAQSVLAADVAAGLAARLDAGLNWGLVDFDGETGKAPQLADTVYVDVGWSSDVKLAIFRAGAFDADRDRRHRRGEGRAGRAGGLLDCAPRWSSRRMPSSRGRRSRTPT